MSLKICVDWDSTCVDESQEWLPGALDGLRWLRRAKHKVVIHSARANYDIGRMQIENCLAEFRLPFKVAPKPDADLYVDDKALRFTRWPDVIKEVRRATAQRNK